MIQPLSPTILNVDHDASQRTTVSGLLQLRGLIVKDAGTGKAALQVARNEPPDVVLLDLDLPDGDGLEVCRSLKSDPSTCGIAVIALSARFADQQEVIRGYHSGANNCIARPVDPDVLAAVIESLAHAKRQQERAQLAAKLEATGRLTGEAARRFDNAIMGLLGDLGLATELLNEEDRPFFKAAIESANRVAELSRDLFTGGGRTRFLVEHVDLSELLRVAEQPIKMSLPGRVRLTLELREALPLTRCDAGQIQQMLFHLVRNAAESIGPAKSGTIAIRTTAGYLDERSSRDYIGYADIQPGQYVFLQIEDSGSGIDASVRTQMFDPFFSTKEPGRGLGLPTVLGILRSHGGGIHVASVAGKGATVTVCLAAAD